MRRLVLVLNILVGTSLLAQSADILAATVDTKAHKNNHQRGHTIRLRGKSKNPRSLMLKDCKIQAMCGREFVQVCRYRAQVRYKICQIKPWKKTRAYQSHLLSSHRLALTLTK